MLEISFNATVAALIVLAFAATTATALVSSLSETRALQRVPVRIKPRHHTNS